MLNIPLNGFGWNRHRLAGNRGIKTAATARALEVLRTGMEKRIFTQDRALTLDFPEPAVYAMPPN